MVQKKRIVRLRSLVDFCDLTIDPFAKETQPNIFVDFTSISVSQGRGYDRQTKFYHFVVCSTTLPSDQQIHWRVLISVNTSSIYAESEHQTRAESYFALVYDYLLIRSLIAGGGDPLIQGVVDNALQDVKYDSVPSSAKREDLSDIMTFVDRYETDDEIDTEKIVQEIMNRNNVSQSEPDFTELSMYSFAEEIESKRRIVTTAVLKYLAQEKDEVYIVEYFPVERYDNQVDRIGQGHVPVLPDLSDAIPLIAKGRILINLPIIGQTITVSFVPPLNVGLIPYPTTTLTGQVVGIRYRDVTENDYRDLPSSLKYFPKVAQVFVEDRKQSHLVLNTLMHFGFGPESKTFYAFHELIGLVKGYKVGLLHRNRIAIFQITNVPEINILEVIGAELSEGDDNPPSEAEQQEILFDMFEEFLPEEGGSEVIYKDGFILAVPIISLISEEMIELNEDHYRILEAGVEFLPTSWSETGEG